MTIYNSVAEFGSLQFSLSDVTPSEKPSTLKTKLGKTFVEKNIPMRDANDTVLQISGLLNGLSRTSAQTISEAIEVDRAALIALQDGTYHAYDDGRYSGNFAIVPETLVFEDDANNMPGQPMKFTMTLVQWQ